MNWSLSDAVREKQGVENPYSPGSDPELYDRFAEGWYSGYLAFQVASIFVGGGEVIQTVKSSERFSQITGSLASKMDDVKALLRASKAFRVTERVGVFMAEVALITAKIGLTAGAISEGVFSSIIVMVVVMAIGTPPLLKAVFDERKPGRIVTISL